MSDMEQDEIDKLLADALGGGASEEPTDAPPSSDGPQSQEDIDALLAEAGAAAPAGNDEGPQSQGDIDALLAEAGGAAPEEKQEDEGPQSQSDIDALLAEAGGAAPEEKQEEEGPQSQSDIDALLAEAGGAAPEEKQEEEGPQSQSDIDALLAEAGGAAPEEKQEDEGPQSQSDIDALLAEAGGAAPEEKQEEEGPQSQSDIDALLAEAGGAAPEAEQEDEGPQSQGDIDALLAEAGGAAPEAEPEDEGAQSQDDIDALLAEAGGAAPEAEPEDEGPQDQNDIDALLAEANAAAPQQTEEPQEQGDAEAAATAPTQESAIDESSIEETTLQETVGSKDEDKSDLEDVEGIIKKSSEPELSHASTQIMDGKGVSDALQAVSESSGTPQDTEERLESEMMPQEANAAKAIFEEETVAPEPVEFMHNDMTEDRPATQLRQRREPEPAPEPLPHEKVEALQKSLSLIGSAGEIEGISGQIASLLGQLSERAQRYQNAWLGTDNEAKELRTRLSSDEHRISALQSERDALREEIDKLRSKVSNTEGEKLAAIEAAKTEASSLQVRVRENESRCQMLEAEVETLKEELKRARNEATGSDVESRRARFEADRIKGDLESERMERQRLHRALDNREKELQALQSQSSGHASGLFLDELHRLVRRLESELDVRTSAAHEALAIMEKLRVAENMVPVISNLRAALNTAAGLHSEDEDALMALSREAEKAAPLPDSPEGEKPAPTLDDFEAHLNKYEIGMACDAASALIRANQTTPAVLAQKVYLSPTLRRPEVCEHLDNVVRLLKGIKELQESADKARGSESRESEKLFAQIFDYLHNMVRLKLITRATASAWNFFLDVRSRFSFVTSDKQWSEYRDRVLGE